MNHTWFFFFLIKLRRLVFNYKLWEQRYIWYAKFFIPPQYKIGKRDKRVSNMCMPFFFFLISHTHTFPFFFSWTSQDSSVIFLKLYFTPFILLDFWMFLYILSLFSSDTKKEKEKREREREYRFGFKNLDPHTMWNSLKLYIYKWSN